MLCVCIDRQQHRPLFLQAAHHGRCLKSESARLMVSLPLSIWHSFCSATVVPQCQHLALTKCSKLSFSQSPLHCRVSLPAWPPYGLSHCQAMQGSLSMMRSFTS